MTSSFEMRSSFLALAKSQTSFVAVPMIPLVDEWLVHLLQKHQAAMITTPYVGLRDSMSAAATRIATRWTAKSSDGTSMKWR